MTGPDFYPKEANLGKNCQFWSIGGLAAGCCFPKAEIQGRRSCEGIVDDVCLFLKDGRPPASLSKTQADEIKMRAPDLDNKSYLPPGDII
jgi:hypothetical protein